MNKNFLNWFIMIIIFITSSIKAQWIRINPPDSVYYQPIYIETLTVSNDEIYALGFEKGIYRSSDSGENWQLIPGLKGHFLANIFSGNNILYISYADGSFLRSTDKGDTWKSIDNTFLFYSNFPGDTTNAPIYCLVSTSSQTFIGTYIGIFKSTNDGISWASASKGLPWLYTNDSTLFTPIWLLLTSGSNLFAATGTNGVFISKNNGQSWSTASTGLPIDSSYSYGGILYYPEVISWISNGSVILASVEDKGVYRTTDNGNSWDEVNNGLPPFTTIKNFVVKDSMIFAQGVFAIYSTKDNGDSWELVSQGNFGNGNLVLYHSNFYYCDYSGVHISTDDGRNWKLSNNGLGDVLSQYPYSIDSFDSILAVNMSGDFSQSISMDGGIVWQDFTINDTNVNSYAAAGANFFKLDKNYFIKTNKEGIWKRIFSPTSGQPTSYLYTNDMIMVDTTLFAATNEGVWYTGYSNESLKYNGDPINWNIKLPGLECYSLTTNGTNIYVGTSNGIYKSNNFGVEWVQIGLNNKIVSNLFSVNSNFIANSDGDFYRSTDGGQTWKYFNIGLKNIRSLTLCRNNIYAVTYVNKYQDGMIWKRSFDDIITNVQTGGNLPTELLLSQNYPNPFNPTTKIEYTIPKRSFVTLKIYDILGREEATLVNKEKPAGYYTVDFNGSTLTSGIYFYKLRAGSYISVKKMILLK